MASMYKWWNSTIFWFCRFLNDKSIEWQPKKIVVVVVVTVVVVCGGGLVVDVIVVLAVVAVVVVIVVVFVVIVGYRNLTFKFGLVVVVDKFSQN